MIDEERRLFIETISEMKELKGAMKEFRNHVIGRIEKLEQREGERCKERHSTLSLIIAFAALVVSIGVSFLKQGGGR